MTDTATAALQERYPPARRRRLWIPLAIVLAVAGLVWLVWAGWYGATGTVTARVDAFSVTSDTRMQVTVSVDRPDAAVAATCRLFAQAATYERVAELPITIEAGGPALATRTYTLNTVGRATTADVEDCHTVG